MERGGEFAVEKPGADAGRHVVACDLADKRRDEGR